MAACVAILSGGLGLPAASAKTEDWTDKQGARFRAEPVAPFGPLALFRLSRTTSRKVPLGQLTPADCLRFYEQVKERSERASDWTDAKSAVCLDLRGYVSRVQQGKLVAADLKGEPEPELFVVCYVDNGIGDSWQMIDQVMAPYTKLKAAYPALLEGVFFGLRHTRSEHANMAISKNVPWLVADRSQESQMFTLADLAPGSGYALAVVTREGVPLLGAVTPDAATVTRLLDELAGMLELINPDNPRTWADRAYYERIVQPVRHAHGECGPVLLGNPLKPQGLRERRIRQVDATLAVGADGAVTEVTIKPDGDVPPAMIAPLADALMRACVFVPAVKDGQFVAGTYPFHLVVAP